MTAALDLASQGLGVFVLEKGDALGGNLLHVKRTLDGQETAGKLADLIKAVNDHPNITVHLNAKVRSIAGYVGNFTTTLEGLTAPIEHGVVIVATGAQEYEPTEYLAGQDGRVVTQRRLEEMLHAMDTAGLAKLNTVAMIQCVGSRDTQHNYCSRVCCSQAIKNAILLKQLSPRTNVYVLYRDIRSYGLRERYYRQARELGVIFVRFEADAKPTVEKIHGELVLRVYDSILGATLEMRPDLLVLSTGIVANADNRSLSQLLKVPLEGDGFFLEAHVKLRPVDFASEGLFLCGTAHAPKFISESISQANAVAARAASILSREVMPVSAQIACVDPEKCVSCMTCVHVCPYLAPIVGEENKAQIQPTVCMGCGSCTSECPAKAITLRHYVDTQILGAIERLLGEIDESTKAPAPAKLAAPSEGASLEQVGIAKPRWTKG